MTDIRLKTRRLNVGGRDYEITCNMNVLADLQEAHGGSIAEALDVSGRGVRAALEIAAAMLNDAADAQGLPERFTDRSLGRLIPPARIGELSDIVTELVSAALADPEPDPDGEAGAEDDEKNA